MTKKVVTQTHAAATITATGNSAALLNTKKTGPLYVGLIANLGAAPTGTSPTLVFALAVSDDGTNFVRVANAVTATMNSQTLGVMPATPITAAYYRIEWTVGGSASPTFTLVTANATAV